MKVTIDSNTLKSPVGIVVAIVVVAVAVGWMHHRRSTLIEQGTAEVVRYLELELPAEYMRRVSGTPDPETIEQLKRVEVISFTPSWFFRADRDDTVRVKTVVRTGTGETRTVYFRFKSVLGSWRLEHETHRPLLDVFFD